MSQMKDIPIKNPEFLELLEDCRKILTDNIEEFVKNNHLHCEHQTDKESRDKWMSEDYLRYIVDVEGDQHEGFPDHLVGYSFKPHQLKHNMFSEYARKNNPEYPLKMLKRITECNHKLVNFLGAKNSALFCFYPPGGYISWHNNANACAYNLICTWSETGDGWFKYRNPDNGEIVTLHDEKGWQCKAGYFGGYRERDKLLYHAAQSDCWRLTVSFIWDHRESSETLQEDLVYEISSE